MPAGKLWVVAGVLTCLVAPVARAETLADAIALAYEANPTLQSQRAQLRALDESYVQARAGFRPTLTATTTVNRSEQLQSGVFGGATETVSETGQGILSATQPLYTGGRTTAQVDNAKAQIEAGREQLRSAEATLLLSVIQAYCDVIRDRASYAIQRDSLKALEDAFGEIKDRFEAGANTHTDVDQAAAQIEAARALVAAAQAQAEVSVAEYVSSVGQSPGDLAPPPTLADLPPTVDKAFDIAEAESPAIRQAQYTEAAGRAQIMEARAAQRPTVSFTGTYGEASASSPFDHHDYDHAATVTLNVTQPIFTGGVTSSQIRQAIQQNSSQRLQVDAARRTAIQQVSQAWSQRRGADLSAIAYEAQVKVAQGAYDGTREEYRAGLRSTLDVLIAEQTLRDAQIALAQARHDAYVTEAALLSAVGRLEARVVTQGVKIYDPAISFKRVEHAGAVPWEFIPAAFDAVGAARLDQPHPVAAAIPTPGEARMTPVTPDADAPLSSAADHQLANLQIQIMERQP